MIEFKVEIAPNVDDDYSTIINEYWQMSDNEFVNKPKQINARYNITLAELNKIIKDFSRCDITHAHCSECGQAIVSSVYSQTSFKENKRKIISKCNECSHQYYMNIESEKQRLKAESQLSMEKKFELAVQERRWNQLTDEELEILRKIVHFKDKKLINKEVFNGNFYDKSIWFKVKRIEKLGLIEIEREDSGSIIRFLFPAILEKEIFTDSAIGNVELDFLGFSLAKNIHKTNVRQPDYSGTFILSRPVKLEAEIKYIYGGWINTDGSINLKIQPLANITQRVENNDMSSEPTHIKNIIENLFNHPSSGDIEND
jgi:RNase P subunit RPR2